MIYPEGDALKERVRNRYSLVVLASKRAKQIKEGAPPLIDTSSTNSLTIALEEIAAGKVSYIEQREAVEDDESPVLFDAITEFKGPSDDALGSDIEEHETVDSQAEANDATGSAPEVDVELHSDQPEETEEA